MTPASAYEAAAALSRSDSEPGLLETLVAAAMAASDARYGVALLVGPDGAPSCLVHRGMDPVDVASLPHLPRPVGLVGVVLTGQLLRLERMAEHPAAAGFPARHVPMQALLGVPMYGEDGSVVGSVYLTRGPGEGAFGDDDERSVLALASQAAVVVGRLRAAQANAQLLDALGILDERATDVPAARGVSPVVRRLIGAARGVLGMELTFLSQLHDGAQTFHAVDTGPSAPPLVEGTTIAAEDGFCHLMLSGDIPAAVPDVDAHPVLGATAVTTDLGIGGYCGVPVRLPDGELYGTLCGLDGDASRPPSGAQLAALNTIAGLIGARLADERQQRTQRLQQRDAFASLVTAPHRSTVLQPIRQLTDGRSVGFEALSRFRDPHGASRPPDRVFAQAAELGIGVQLEQAAARDALALLPLLPPGTYLSVNLSASALLDPATFDLLVAADPEAIVVELTEHEQVPDYSALLRVLGSLRARGVRLAVDDAGAGFASLQHLMRLGPEIIKLDAAFVRDIDTDPSRRAVAAALTGFAHDVGALLIAEGIETAAELELLRALGAPLGQGYHLGRPADPALVLTATPQTATVHTPTTC